MFNNPISHFDFIHKALKPFKKNPKYNRKKSRSLIEYLQSGLQTYFKVPYFSQPLTQWYLGSRIESYQYQFNTYLFFYFITKELLPNRIAIYLTSCNQNYFSIKIALYSNINMGLGFIVEQDGEKMINKVLNSSLTHTFFIPLKQSFINITISLNHQKQIFSFNLKPAF